MKSILKLFLFMGIILLSKFMRENEIATASATTKANKVEKSLTNYQQQVEEIEKQKENEAAEVVL